MNITTQAPLPTYGEIKKALPLSCDIKDFITSSRHHCNNICQRKKNGLVIILGPCSIHDETSAIEYAKNIAQLQHRLKSNITLIMRFYYEKPRSCIGWKGFLYDPFITGRGDINAGIVKTRKLLLKIASLKVPVATEFLDPTLSPYFDDLISWGFIGARTSLSQIHRQLASSFTFPVGLKNSLDGNLPQLVDGAISSSRPHRFAMTQDNGRLYSCQSKGNASINLVLRGDNNGVNYKKFHINQLLRIMENKRQFFPIVIDCSHDNYHGKESNQITTFFSVVTQIINGNDNIVSIMIESNINKGKQEALTRSAPLKYGVSITDPCIDWEITEKSILSADLLIQHSRIANPYHPLPLSYRPTAGASMFQ
jgi:3-deoxy-7-phosphoheptulonate synthase